MTRGQVNTPPFFSPIPPFLSSSPLWVKRESEVHKRSHYSLPWVRGVMEEKGEWCIYSPPFVFWPAWPEFLFCFVFFHLVSCPFPRILIANLVATNSSCLWRRVISLDAPSKLSFCGHDHLGVKFVLFLFVNLHLTLFYVFAYFMNAAFYVIFFLFLSF